MNYVDFRGSNLSYADISNCDLRKVLLGAGDNYPADSSHEDAANLQGAIITNSNLMRLNLAEIDFTGASLSDSNCSQARFTRAILKDTSMYNLNLSGADLRETVELTREQLVVCASIKDAKLPVNLEPQRREIEKMISWREPNRKLEKLGYTRLDPLTEVSEADMAIALMMADEFLTEKGLTPTQTEYMPIVSG